MQGAGLRQENMKEIEKLFETEFDYTEEFRGLAVHRSLTPFVVLWQQCECRRQCWAEVGMHV